MVFLTNEKPLSRGRKNVYLLCIVVFIGIDFCIALLRDKTVSAQKWNGLFRFGEVVVFRLLDDSAVLLCEGLFDDENA